jgi:transcription termination factor NusB
MARLSSQEAVEFLRNLTVQMQNKNLSKSDARRLAIIALQEVVENDPQPQPAAQEEKPVEKEDDKDTNEADDTDIRPPASAIDPKTKLLSLMTRLQETIQAQLKKLEQEVTSILKTTEGAAVPLGDFSIGSDESSAKVTIEHGDQPAVAKVSYTLKREWEVSEVLMPVTASAPKSCNLPLRQEILELCAEVDEHTTSELAWRRKQKDTRDTLIRLASIAKTTGDYRASDILENTPVCGQAESWGNWAKAGQIFLLGSDYTEGKGFTSTLRG